MEQRPLGRTGLDVSAICLGTMTWGTQNTEAEGHAQMDYALDRGVTFWDTAEMYSVPPTAESYGSTERIIGSWFARTGKRNQVFLASKISGPGGHMAYIRDGKPRLDARNIKAAVEASLKRLQTDWIDLYQLHWPNRSVNSFGKLGYAHDQAEDFVAPEETLAALADEVKAGRIRHVGLSNETPWGLMRFVEASDRLGLPRPVSIQNPYNLLNRSFEVGLAECAHREAVGLLGYAPLAAATLTGKYLDGQVPPGSRRDVDRRKSRYDRLNAEPATKRYIALARDHGLDPAQMAIAYALSRPFMTSVIIGATSMDHLRANIAAADITLSPEVLEGIEAIHTAFPNPCP
ncbi:MULTISPECIES: aldo/keto reductase [Inquilinus]|uniref:Aryl-alcohol dehydrogenase-like predicted oxidoreductase n=1 Tax=Inquilinus ginsengisoli TaxID=363840 RepID=A0ABU1JTK6_9PROT|nr:aldo/keto reductase [Inquilinus ginsengisoli]MDR6291951.1 aryl-alcohol dehydrogenase-like predicted oxidoreductase [Inquilinus ginsengisoli]